MSTSQVTGQTKQDFSQLLPPQEGTEQFIKLFVDPTDGKKSINEDDPANIVNFPDAYKFMKAEDYNKKEPGMKDNDVHYEFTDFIINLALFQRQSQPRRQMQQAEAQQAQAQAQQAQAQAQQAQAQQAQAQQGIYSPPMSQYGGQNVSAIKDVIPKFTKKDNIFGDIWYTDSNGRRQKISTAGWVEDANDSNGAQNFFKNLLAATYRGKKEVQVTGAPAGVVSVNAPVNFNPNWKRFDLDADSVVRKRLFAIQQELKQPAKVQGPVISFTDKNIWKVDETGRLYMEEGGKRVYYGENDEGSMKVLKQNFKCYSTFANVSGAECDKYVNQCLLSNDADSLKTCIEMWKRKDFYTASTDEIKNMHPMVALRTLQKFGFMAKPVEDSELKITIKKVESVDHWVKRVLSKTFGQQKSNAGESLQSIIEGNENILNYLRLLVEYVNGNPSILNRKEIAGRTSEAAGKLARSELAYKLRIPMIKQPKGPEATFYDYSMLKSYMDVPSLIPRRAISVPTSGFGNQFAASFAGSMYRSPFSTSSYGFQIPYQLGGMYQAPAQDQIVTGSEALLSLINNTVGDLKAMGKTIAQEDLDTIHKKVENMKNLENELVKTAMYLEVYKYYIELFKNYKSEYLTLSQVQGLAEKYKDLLSKQSSEENLLVKILGSLQGLRQGKCADEFVDDSCLYEPITVDTSMLPAAAKKMEEECIPKQKIC
jgi:hypothetical protein